MWRSVPLCWGVKGTLDSGILFISSVLSSWMKALRSDRRCSGANRSCVRIMWPRFLFYRLNRVSGITTDKPYVPFGTPGV